MTRRLAELYRLPRRERAALLRAWVALLLVRLALRVLSLPRLLRLVAGHSPASTARPLSAERLLALADIAARHVPRGATCLERSLVTRHLLARHGHAAVLHLGVVRRDGGLEAHAWLAHEGRALGAPGAHEAYEVLTVLASGGLGGPVAAPHELG